MNDIRQIIGLVAGLIIIASFVPYIVSIFKGKTKPNRATYGIWSFVGIMTISSYIASGATTTVWIGLVYAVLTTLVFALSFKYGVGGLHKLDIACIIGAALGVTLWIVTKNPQTALYTGISVEILGSIPTWKKSYSQPETEDLTAWVMDTFATLLNLFAITAFTVQIALYPLYGFLASTLVTMILLYSPARDKRFKRPKHLKHS